ncbi:hypothetical protein P154DRAFT_257357 [Amniculicola lignicola CBS 123094]|uniref:Uncharacterized protein n=1 Tax=Amniculicola lignicola CBS 123094 TaxID=1392246 RepID=A0A6A5WYV1_9PLEO|nr:hypothetical protein P154DRAFT_257357 [Amniculicola lignicola CBS 123094]
MRIHTFAGLVALLSIAFADPVAGETGTLEHCRSSRFNQPVAPKANGEEDSDPSNIAELATSESYAAFIKALDSEAARLPEENGITLYDGKTIHFADINGLPLVRMEAKPTGQALEAYLSHACVDLRGGDFCQLINNERKEFTPYLLELHGDRAVWAAIDEAESKEGWSGGWETLETSMNGTLPVQAEPRMETTAMEPNSDRSSTPLGHGTIASAASFKDNASTTLPAKSLGKPTPSSPSLSSTHRATEPWTKSIKKRDLLPPKRSVATDPSDNNPHQLQAEHTSTTDKINVEKSQGSILGIAANARQPPSLRESNSQPNRKTPASVTTHPCDIDIDVLEAKYTSPSDKARIDKIKAVICKWQSRESPIVKTQTEQASGVPTTTEIPELLVAFTTIEYEPFSERPEEPISSASSSTQVTTLASGATSLVSIATTNRTVDTAPEPYSGRNAIPPEIFESSEISDTSSTAELSGSLEPALSPRQRDLNVISPEDREILDKIAVSFVKERNLNPTSNLDLPDIVSPNEEIDTISLIRSLTQNAKPTPTPIVSDKEGAKWSSVLEEHRELKSIFEGYKNYWDSVKAAEILKPSPATATKTVTHRTTIIPWAQMLTIEHPNAHSGKPRSGTDSDPLPTSSPMVKASPSIVTTSPFSVISDIPQPTKPILLDLKNTSSSKSTTSKSTKNGKHAPTKSWHNPYPAQSFNALPGASSPVSKLFSTKTPVSITAPSRSEKSTIPTHHASPIPDKDILNSLDSTQDARRVNPEAEVYYDHHVQDGKDVIVGKHGPSKFDQHTEACQYHEYSVEWTEERGHERRWNKREVDRPSEDKDNGNGHQSEHRGRNECGHGEEHEGS